MDHAVRGRRALALVLAGLVPAAAGAQQVHAAPATPTAPPALVLDQVTVVDVAQGTLVRDQRLVIADHRIRALGGVRAITVPKGAQVIDARGKYVMPGLWDMHVSPSLLSHLYYPRLLAYGVTGIRNAGAPIPLDMLRRWRQEILAGTRVGPPRQLLAPRLWEWPNQGKPCFRNPPSERSKYIYLCVEGAEHARHVVDSLQTAGVDMLTVTGASRDTYFAMIAEARRLGIPFAGKDGGRDFLAESDSGARILDDFPKELAALCDDSSSGSVERCQPVAERLRRNGTWVTLQQYGRSEDEGGSRSLQTVQRVGLPLLAMSYVRGDYAWEDNLPGSSLHETLADYVARGLTPLQALQSATLNPALLLHATDSLGTVAAGKLADLVLLDANPLADITNTTTIRAVIANGRYFDRAALDGLLAEVRTIAPD